MILVTGATGLVGAHLVQALVQQGRQVKALYRTHHPAINNALVQWYQADILDIIALEEVMQDVTEVYHCAAIVSFHPSARQTMFKVNIEGTANVVNTCLAAGVQKLCYVSSVASLGRIRPGEIVNETMNWSAETSNSNYGESKYLAEMEVWRGIAEGLQAVVVNPVIILGAGDWNTGSSGIFKSAYDEFPWYTDGESGFVDVQDVVKAMMLLMHNNVSNKRFIISGGNRKYKDLFTLIALAFGKKPPYKKVTPFMAAIVWRIEKIKALFSKQKPLLTRETAHTAQAIAQFDNSKLLAHLPAFTYTPLEESVKRIIKELQVKYNLPR